MVTRMMGRGTRYIRTASSSISCSSVGSPAGKLVASRSICGGGGRGGQQAPLAHFSLAPGTYHAVVRFSSGATRSKEINVGAQPVRTLIDDRRHEQVSPQHPLQRMRPGAVPGGVVEVERTHERCGRADRFARFGREIRHEPLAQVWAASHRARHVLGAPNGLQM